MEGVFGRKKKEGLYIFFFEFFYTSEHPIVREEGGQERKVSFSKDCVAPDPLPGRSTRRLGLHFSFD